MSEVSGRPAAPPAEAIFAAPAAAEPSPSAAAASGPPPARRRLKRTVLALLLLVLLGCDLAQPPARQVSAWLLLGAIHLYQATLSPHMRDAGVQCRFKPTCSHYAAGAIERYGALSGSLRTAWRLARCGPWTPLGTYDPP
jgi:putative membrane protein insertion efficiency factor